MAKVLIIDDEEINRLVLSKFLNLEGHETILACDGVDALEKINPKIDIILMDLTMPRLDGLSATRKIRESETYSHIPIIIVTGSKSTEVRLDAVQAGANDFIGKPFDEVELKIRMDAQLKLKNALDKIKQHELELELAVKERTQELQIALDQITQSERRTHEAHLDTINRLAVAAESSDITTGSHILRVTKYVQLLSQLIGLPAEKSELITQASPLHDIGKVGIPHRIITKPGKLTSQEMTLMKTHTDIGAKILKDAPNELMQIGHDIALYHHERYDGTGYPNNIGGEDIPLPGRICALADVLDALLQERPYKPAYDFEKATSIIRDGRGTHFDPILVEAFMDNLRLFAEINQSR